jgi:hypothetical protein
MHLTLRSIIAAIGRAIATTTIVAPLGTAAGAALWVLVATAGMELLVVSGEGEVPVALDTGQGTVSVIQVFQLSSMGLVNVRTELEDYCVQSKVQSVPGGY